MKKTIIIFGIVLILTAAAVGVSTAYAQAETPTEVLTGTEFHGRGHGKTFGGHILRPYMQAAVADALGMSVDELQAAHAAGLNAWDLAQAQGISESEIRDLLFTARNEAISAAVNDGVITEEIADALRSRFLQMLENGVGNGTCDGSGFGSMQNTSRSGGRHGRFGNGQFQP